ncbi:hypothetical protein NW795_25575, partial [Escherichia coli]|nr:hypothetical protein [Escherichia coli]
YWPALHAQPLACLKITPPWFSAIEELASPNSTQEQTRSPMACYRWAQRTRSEWQFSITAVISSMKSGLVPLVPIWL